MSLLGAAAILGGIKAASGITEGVIGARAAKKEQERIDDELKRLRKNRGLSAREKSAMEADQAARRAGIERTMQSQGDEQLAVTDRPPQPQAEAWSASRRCITSPRRAGTIPS